MRHSGSGRLPVEIESVVGLGSRDTERQPERYNPDGGAPLEPIEEVQIDVDDAFAGDVVNALAERRAELIGLRPSRRDKTRARFHGPSCGLIGFDGELLAVILGTAIMHRSFHRYAPFRSPIAGQWNDVLALRADEKPVRYALWSPKPRRTLYVRRGMLAYWGMIVGERARSNP